MNTFKKSESNLSHSLKLPIPIDIITIQREFEECVVPYCNPSISTNPKRIGWKRYTFYSHPDYRAEEKHKIDFDISSLPYFNNLLKVNFYDSRLIQAMYAIIPAKGFIGIHQDGLGSNNPTLKRLIEDTIRIHIPIYTNELVNLYIGDRFQSMKEGECWMLNNYSYHGVINRNAELSRNHLIFDVIPSKKLLKIMESGKTPEGFKDTKILKLLMNNSSARKAKEFKQQLSFIDRLKFKFT